jgi:hypothetical protein
MSMHNPPHPGEFISSVYLEPYGVSLRKLAERLDVVPSTLARLIRKPLLHGLLLGETLTHLLVQLSGGKPGCLSQLAGLLRVGWRCSTTMTCGGPASGSIFARLRSSMSMPANKGDSADRSTRHLVCIRKPRAGLPGR